MNQAVSISSATATAATLVRHLTTSMRCAECCAVCAQTLLLLLVRLVLCALRCAQAAEQSPAGNLPQ
jgi:hypothetical protein